MIKPIQLSTILVSKTDQNFTSNNKSEQHTDFKATLLNNNNNNYSKNQSIKDDSSIDQKYNSIYAARRFSETNGNNTGRAHTVQCKPNKWKRPALNLNPSADEKGNINEDETNQKFTPAYASVSSIRIDNHVTCLEAIQILLDKYHVRKKMEILFLFYFDVYHFLNANLAILI